MKSMIVGLVSLVVVWSVQAGPSNTLDSVKGSYEAQRQGLLAGYGKSLDTVLAAMKKAGDLNGVLAVNDEKSRFEAERVVPVASNGVLKAIGDVQLAYQHSVVSLMKRYVAALDGLVKDMVKQDRIAEAKDAKAEINKVLFEIADLETKTPQVEKKSTPDTKVSAIDRAKEMKGKSDAIVGRWTITVNQTGWKAQVNVKKDGKVEWSNGSWKQVQYWSVLGTNDVLFSSVRGVKGDKGWSIVHLPAENGTVVCDDWQAGANSCTMQKME